MTDIPTIAILPARAGNPTDTRRNRDAAKAYCDAHGWGEIEVIENQLEGDMCPGGDPSAGRLASVFSRAHGGGRLLVGDLTTLSHRPDDLLKACLALISQGVDLHSLELAGPVLPHLAGMRIGLNIAAETQAELDAVAGRSRAEVNEAWAEASKFQREFVSRWVKRHGVPADGLASFDDVMPMPPNPYHDAKAERERRVLAELRRDMEAKAAAGDEFAKEYLAAEDGAEKDEAHARGEAIRAARLERGWDLATLGAAAGISKSQVHRIEVEGKAGGAGECLAALGLDDVWQSPQASAKSVPTLDEAANAG